MNLSVLFASHHGEDHDILPETTQFQHQLVRPMSGLITVEIFDENSAIHAWVTFSMQSCDAIDSELIYKNTTDHLGLIHHDPFRIRKTSTFDSDTVCKMSANKLAASCHITARLYIINIQSFHIFRAEYTVDRFVTAALRPLPAKRPSRIKNISTHLWLKLQFQRGNTAWELLQILLQ